jgi:hypothetical protein
VSFVPGSSYQVEVNPAGQNDKLLATGTATLTGGTVQVLAAPGSYGLTTKYTILTANGGVNGTFAGSTSNFAFFTPTLTYDADDVFLTLTRNSSALASIAQTPNQRAVAGALDASAFGSTLVQAIVGLSTPQALQAFDALSGEIHASTRAMMFEDSGYLRQAALGRLRSAADLGGAATLAPLAFGGPMLAYAATPAFPIKAPKKLTSPIEGPDITFWAQDFGAWGTIDGDGNAAQAKRNLGGIFAGVDARAGATGRAGLVTGYSHSDVRVDARASRPTSTASISGLRRSPDGRVESAIGRGRDLARYCNRPLDHVRGIRRPGECELPRQHLADIRRGRLRHELRTHCRRAVRRLRVRAPRDRPLHRAGRQCRPHRLEQPDRYRLFDLGRACRDQPGVAERDGAHAARLARLAARLRRGDTHRRIVIPEHGRHFRGRRRADCAR